jgi:hypothetical protein
MIIKLLAGGLSTMATDRASALKWIDEQEAQGERVTFTVECDDPILQQSVKRELSAQVSKWRP